MKNITNINVNSMCPICKNQNFTDFDMQEKYDNELIEKTCQRIIRMIEDGKLKCNNNSINKVLDKIGELINEQFSIKK